MRIYLRARMLPGFGKTALDRIGPEDVGKWFEAASQDKPGAANGAFEILRSMMPDVLRLDLPVETDAVARGLGMRASGTIVSPKPSSSTPPSPRSEGRVAAE